MRVATIFCSQAESERDQDENDDSFFSGCENESLPDAFQFQTPRRFQFWASFCQDRIRTDR